MTTHYALASDSLGPEEIEAAVSVLKSGRYTMGEKVRQFEKALASWVGVKHALMVNSGSSANLLLVESWMRRTCSQVDRLIPGDEVLVPGLAWPTTVWPLAQLGLIPVYVDVDPSTLAICLKSAEAALSSRTRGMFLIHVLGQACKMEAYLQFCQKHHLVLAEDCCESFGAFDERQHVGTFGCAGTLSHFFSHHLTTMEGGSIITNDDTLIDDLRSFRAHGWTRDRSDQQKWVDQYPQIDPSFLFITTGYNVRPLEIQAAIGLIQLPKMDAFLAERERVAQLVQKWVTSCAPWMRLIGQETLPSLAGKNHQSEESPTRSRQHSWMTLPFCLEADAPLSVEQVKHALKKWGVDTRPIIAGNLAKHPASQAIHSRVPSPLQVCDEILQRGFMMGCHPNSSPESLELLQKAFQSFKNKG